MCCCDCDTVLCVVAFDEKAWCDAYDDTGPDCSGTPGAISGASVEIVKVVGETETPFASGSTGEDGKFCVDIATPGTYKVTVHPEECNTYSRLVDLGCHDGTVDLGFSFCCWSTDVNTYNFDDSSPVDASISGTGLSGGCTDEGGGDVSTEEMTDGTIIGWCDGFEPCPAPETPPSHPCLDNYQFTGEYPFGIEPSVVASHEGFIDRCFNLESPCGVPAIETVKSIAMFPTDTWVKNPCCGCEKTDSRPREVIRKSLQVRILGPEGITGSNVEQTYALYYNETRSDAGGYLVWDTGCLPGQGGWGICRAPYSYICLQYQADPELPCVGLFPLPGADYTDHVNYLSTRISLLIPKEGYDPLTCTGYVVWENFWTGACNPDDDPAPYCGWDYDADPYSDPPPAPVYAQPVAKLCTVQCPCGLTPIGSVPENVEPVGTALNYYPSKQMVIPVSPMCGAPLSASGSGQVSDPEEPFHDCFGPVDLGFYAYVEEV